MTLLQFRFLFQPHWLQVYGSAWVEGRSTYLHMHWAWENDLDSFQVCAEIPLYSTALRWLELAQAHCAAMPCSPDAEPSQGLLTANCFSKQALQKWWPQGVETGS